MDSARRLVDCLRRWRNEFGWDLAETALRESEGVLKRIEDALPRHTPVGMVEDSFWDNPFLQYQGFGWQGQPEEIFPGVFSELNADGMVFDVGS